MPFKTRYGKHYHMTEGCHGATIPCDTKGLTPCSDCCGNAGKGGIGGGSPANSIPAGTTVISGGGRSVSIDGTVIETRKVGAGISPLQEGTLYRLDTRLSDEQGAMLEALPGVWFMRDEESLDLNESSSAFIVRDFGTRYTVAYAQTISDLGIRALGQGMEIPSEDIDTMGIASWLASNQENEWKTVTMDVRLADSEPIRADAVYADDGVTVDFPSRTMYELSGEPWYLARQTVVGTEGLGMASRHGKSYLCVYDGYEAIMRDTPNGMRLGVRKHYDRPILRNAGDAEWKVIKSGKDGETVQAEGVAYRTPAGDATIRMTVSPDPRFPEEANTTIEVDDPFLGRTITLASNDVSHSKEYAMRNTCERYLQRANLGARKQVISGIRKAYEENLPALARKRIEGDGIDVTEVRRLSGSEVEIRGLEGGYVPVTRRVRLEADGTISSYAK